MTNPRIRTRTLDPTTTLLVLDHMPELDREAWVDWHEGRTHLAAHGIIALRFTHGIDLEDER